MPREINAKIDVLFVEGTDDGVVVNAFVQKLMGIDLARLVQSALPDRARA